MPQNTARTLCRTLTPRGGSGKSDCWRSTSPQLRRITWPGRPHCSTEVWRC